MTPKLLSATSIEGTKVINAKDEKIGEIKDLMIDWENGSVAYAVLSFGGVMGLGEKLFAIPLEAFEFNTHRDEEVVLLNVDKESLKEAPGFDKDNWPQNPDRAFIDSVFTYYGYEPYWKRYTNV